MLVLFQPCLKAFYDIHNTHAINFFQHVNIYNSSHTLTLLKYMIKDHHEQSEMIIYRMGKKSANPIIRIL